MKLMSSWDWQAESKETFATKALGWTIVVMESELPFIPMEINSKVKITQKVSFNISSEASYVYILTKSNNVVQSKISFKK